MNDETANDTAPKWQGVRHRVVEVPLKECPFYRPGLKRAIGIDGMWDLEFDDGHRETVYEDGGQKAIEP